jgi:hypothetical protein
MEDGFFDSILEWFKDIFGGGTDEDTNPYAPYVDDDEWEDSGGGGSWDF